MASGPDYDVAIVGGGLAGLSLAVRLAAVPHLRTILIEPRTEYRRDRTWSYWRLHEHPFEKAVAARWHRWSVQARDGTGALRETVQASSGLPYETIPADALYALALGTIGRARHIELRTGTHALALHDEPDRVVVATQAGPIAARYAFDSRPPSARPGGYAQRFLGQEVTVDRPCFDAGTATLMDFAVAGQPGSVRFLYVLPTSPTQALVEDTWLAPSEAVLPDHRGAIQAYLTERFGVADYETRFEEAGAIPMDADLEPPRSGGRIVPIGTLGAAVKPSSGYAFLAIQRMSEALARNLAAGRAPRPVPVRSSLARWMDAVFLTALQHSPERAPDLFTSLFARCSPEPLIRFLNDLGRPDDIARVIAAMPKRPMIAAAFAERGGR